MSSTVTTKSTIFDNSNIPLDSSKNANTFKANTRNTDSNYNTAKIYYNKTYTERKKRSNPDINNQKKDQDARPLDTILNNYEIIEAAISLEKYKESNFDYAYKFHNLLTILLPNVSTLSVNDIHHPKAEDYDEIKRLREMIIIKGFSLRLVQEKKKLDKDLEIYSKHFEGPIKERSMEEIQFYNTLLLKRSINIINYNKQQMELSKLTFDQINMNKNE
ncbi:hypothetical protein COBT_001963 [Conglomerata obtusa]